MSWFRDLLTKRADRSARHVPPPRLKLLQEKFNAFLALLEANNQVLEVIADMEEKTQGEYLFDINYVRTCLAQIRSGVSSIIDNMIVLGGDKYAVLRDRYHEIDSGIEALLRGGARVPPDDFTIPLGQIGSDRAPSVGGKSAQIGELKKVGLPTPDGFAISAWAYRHFLESNGIQEQVNRRLDGIDIKSYEQLASVSEEIRAIIENAGIPDDLAGAIKSSLEELVQRTSSTTFALRSSAIGEDEELSFAGQYITLLNVRGADVLDGYRRVLAGKFSARAIYYLLSHNLSESDFGMSVCCMEMVDAVSSGVIYTQDPTRPHDPAIVVSSIFGLGNYLVDGTLTPDVFYLSPNDGSIISSHIASKPVRLRLASEGGVVQETVPAEEQERGSLGEEQLATLARMASEVHRHYGSPQDIEWAIDRQGRVLLIQTRPLRVVPAPKADQPPQLCGATILSSGGTTVCPGAGIGPICRVAALDDLSRVPDQAVVVAPSAFPGLITIMRKAAAIVTEIGSLASHTATIAREYRIPTLVGVSNAMALPQGTQVTVDASAGVIYAGAHEDLKIARQPEYELFADVGLFKLLSDILRHITPLNLIEPSSAGFVPEKCKTYHDLTRFAHQKAIDEMFLRATRVEEKNRIGSKLKGTIPLRMNIIFLDEALEGDHPEWIEEDNIRSIPLNALWGGMKKERWAQESRSLNVSDFMALVATSGAVSARLEYSETSFAVVSKEYMIAGLHMGYHFTSIEAMCTDNPSQNFIRMQYKEGAASYDRRIRRTRVIAEICSRMGFENFSKGDFLDSRISNRRSEDLLRILDKVGRLMILTKQLDMVLSNDSIADWYAGDFAKQLNMPVSRQDADESDPGPTS